MLVLTRKSDESVIIGNDIEIKILDVRGDQISIGFSAPKNISIYRKEVFEAIQNQNIQAAGNGKQDMKSIKDTLGQHLAAHACTARNLKNQ